MTKREKGKEYDAGKHRQKICELQIQQSMINKCVVTTCTSGFATGEKIPSFLFPEDQKLRRKWIYFVNCKEWIPTKYPVACIDQFEQKFIKHRKN